MRCVVITDAEPDDVAAIMYMLYSGISIEHILIIHQDAGLDHSRIIRELLETYGDDNRSSIPYDSMDAVGRILPHVMKTTQADTIICLANWASLVSLVSTNPDIAKATTVYAYGSVNIRWALGSRTTTDDLIAAVTTGYKSFYCFETFWAFGDRCDLSTETCPEFATKLRTSDNPRWVMLRDLIQTWNFNTLIRFGMRIIRMENVDPSDKKIDVYRKIVGQIERDELQMVCADVGLAVAMVAHINDRTKMVSQINDRTGVVSHPPGQFVPATLDFDENNYTKITQVETSSFYYYIDGDVGAFGEKMSEVE